MTQPPQQGQVVVSRDQLGDLERRAQGTTTADLSKIKVNLRQPLEDLDQAFRISVMLAQSNLLPRQLQGNPQNILIVIMTGMELGLTVTQALRSVFVAKNGMPGLRGEMLLGKLRQAGHDYDYSEPTTEGCVFRLHRGHDAPLTAFTEEQCGKGRDYFGKFTQEDALRARLLTRNKEGELVARSQYGEPLPHELYTPDMYFWRAVSRAIRRGAPEITLGFAIAELDDSSEPPPGPQLPVPADVGSLAVDGVAAHVRQIRQEQELRQLEQEMTPVAGDDTHTGTGPAQGTTEPAAAPDKSGTAPASAVAAGEAGGRGIRTQSDPRAAGAASPQGAQPPPPQGTPVPSAGWAQDAMFEDDQRNLMGDQEVALIDPDCKAGKHSSCVGGPCECREDGHVTDHGLPVDPPRARSAGTRKAATRRGSSTAPPAEPASAVHKLLAEQFDQMGWSPVAYADTLRTLLSDFIRRPVTTGIGELTLAEQEQLSAELRRIMQRYPDEHWPVALADQVEQWREQWLAADPDGYAAAHPD